MISFSRLKLVVISLSLAILLAFVLRFETKTMLHITELSKLRQEALAISMDDEESEPAITVDGLSTATSSITPMPPIHNTDWFQDDPWHDNYFTKDCWHVEDICHSSHRWFYDPRSPNRDRQPSFSIGFYEKDLTSMRIKARASASSLYFLGRPKKIVVETPLSSSSSTNSLLQTCRYSPIPNHIVLQSYYNDMLGEFYTRSLAYIYKFYEAASNTSYANPQKSKGTDESYELHRVSTFPEQTQMYLHVRNFPEHNNLLDSHHVFTDAFRSNPLLSFTYLVDFTGCRCLKRLLLCGYETEGPNRKKIRGVFPVNTSVITELTPAGASGPDYVERDFPDVFRDLRRQLRINVIESNPFLQHDIARFREDLIRHHRPALTALTPQLVSEFRIVGLSQRKGRRKWLNLDKIVRQCNTQWFKDSDRIVCGEINLENADVNPVRQVVIHAACDMLFGIHGAQLTEAVWMKDGSVVVEFLPWIPDNASHGSWTRTTHAPTPLGLMFFNCDLNHIGYPLPRDSAPYCLDQTTPADLKACFAHNLWDNRDFRVAPKVVLNMIAKFAPRKTPVTCKELQSNAGDKVYVLYNVICTTKRVASVHHFYWPKPNTP